MSETGAINQHQLQLLAHLSCKSGTGFICNQILVSVRMLFYSTPFSSQGWVCRVILCFLFNFSLAAVPTIIIAAAVVNSSSMLSLSAIFIFGTIDFFQMHYGTKNGHQKLEQDLWSRLMTPVSGAHVMGLIQMLIQTFTPCKQSSLL